MVLDGDHGFSIELLYILPDGEMLVLGVGEVEFVSPVAEIG
jgi:hypothetical protein